MKLTLKAFSGANLAQDMCPLDLEVLKDPCRGTSLIKNGLHKDKKQSIVELRNS